MKNTIHSAVLILILHFSVSNTYVQVANNENGNNPDTDVYLAKFDCNNTDRRVCFYDW